MFFQEDSLSTAKKFNKPLVLVFASPSPGGGWRDACVHGQEEEIVRSLGIGEKLEALKEHPFYVSSNSSLGSDDLLSLETPHFSLLFAIAPNARKFFVAEGTKTKEKILRKIFEKRLERIINVFLRSEHDTLVLGAWGCGHFGNDPHLVAKVMKQKIAERSADFSLKKVVFALPDPKHFEIFTRPQRAVGSRHSSV